jgi:hypothetical protein
VLPGGDFVDEGLFVGNAAVEPGGQNVEFGSGSKPTTWNQFLPISMPIVATAAECLQATSSVANALAPHNGKKTNNQCSCPKGEGSLRDS